MAIGDESPPGEGELQGPEGLLFTGDAIRALTPEQLATIGRFAREMYGVEMRAVGSVEHEIGGVALNQLEVDRPTPIPMRQKDFKTFAAEHGFAKHTAYSAWHWVIDEVNFRERRERTDLPEITVTWAGGGRAVELNSLYAYFQTAIQRYGVSAASQQQEAFLLALLNERLRPDRPLTTERFKSQNP